MVCINPNGYEAFVGAETDNHQCCRNNGNCRCRDREEFNPWRRLGQLYAEIEDIHQQYPETNCIKCGGRGWYYGNE